MNIIGNTYAETAKAFNGMKNANKNFRQDGKVADAEKTISDMTKEIGRLTASLRDAVYQRIRELARLAHNRQQEMCLTVIHIFMAKPASHKKGKQVLSLFASVLKQLLKDLIA